MAFSICNCSQRLGMFTHNHARSLILGLKSTFLESGILAVQRRELIIEEVHIYLIL